MKFKHTPGPWGNNNFTIECQDCGQGIDVKRVKCCENCDDEESRDLVICDCFGIGDELEANARLIAAAPEMLYELISLCDGNCDKSEPLCSQTECDTCSLHDTKALIERATGMTIEEAIEAYNNKSEGV